MLHFHPGLFDANKAFFAGLSEEGLVKIWDHVFIYFAVAPKDWISWVGCVQEGEVNGKNESADSLPSRIWQG